jgi:hypothetical protein
MPCRIYLVHLESVRLLGKRERCAQRKRCFRDRGHTSDEDLVERSVGAMPKLCVLRELNADDMRPAHHATRSVVRTLLECAFSEACSAPTFP